MPKEYRITYCWRERKDWKILKMGVRTDNVYKFINESLNNNKKQYKIVYNIHNKYFRELTNIIYII